LTVTGGDPFDAIEVTPAENRRRNPISPLTEDPMTRADPSSRSSRDFVALVIDRENGVAPGVRRDTFDLCVVLSAVA
jgi:hypothetical protein